MNVGSGRKVAPKHETQTNSAYNTHTHNKKHLQPTHKDCFDEVFKTQCTGGAPKSTSIEHRAQSQLRERIFVFSSPQTQTTSERIKAQRCAQNPMQDTSPRKNHYKRRRGEHSVQVMEDLMTHNQKETATDEPLVGA